jgi:hypothetical protein
MRTCWHGDTAGAVLVVVLAILICNTLASSPSLAQVPTRDEPFPQIREARRWGPFYVSRSFAIDNIGYDNNVFLVGEEEDRPTESDFVVRLGPEIQAQLKLGHRMALTLRDKLTGEFWAEFTELNSISNDFEGQYDVLLGPVLLTSQGRWNTSFGRARSESDERTRRRSTNLEQRLIWFITPKTDITVTYEARNIRYSDEESSFLVDPDGDGTAERVDIETALNRDTDETRAELGWRPRNRTRFMIGYSSRDQDFLSDQAGRDADETRVYVGAEFRPSAYISGRVEIGRAELKSTDAATGFDYEPYEGTYSDTSLVYRPTGSTRISLGYEQEARFSTYDRNLYYEFTDQSLSVETYLGNWFGVQGGYSRRDLEYPEPNSISQPLGERREDTIDRYYGGLLFRLPRGLELGIRVGRRIRDSNVPFVRDEQNFLETSGSFRF